MSEQGASPDSGMTPPSRRCAGHTEKVSRFRRFCGGAMRGCTPAAGPGHAIAGTQYSRRRLTDP